MRCGAGSKPIKSSQLLESAQTPKVAPHVAPHVAPQRTTKVTKAPAALDKPVKAPTVAPPKTKAALVAAIRAHPDFDMTKFTAGAFPDLNPHVLSSLPQCHDILDVLCHYCRKLSPYDACYQHMFAWYNVLYHHKSSNIDYNPLYMLATTEKKKQCNRQFWYDFRTCVCYKVSYSAASGITHTYTDISPNLLEYSPLTEYSKMEYFPRHYNIDNIWINGERQKVVYRVNA